MNLIKILLISLVLMSVSNASEKEGNPLDRWRLQIGVNYFNSATDVTNTDGTQAQYSGDASTSEVGLVLAITTGRTEFSIDNFYYDFSLMYKEVVSNRQDDPVTFDVGDYDTSASTKAYLLTPKIYYNFVDSPNTQIYISAGLGLGLISVKGDGVEIKDGNAVPGSEFTFEEKSAIGYTFSGGIGYTLLLFKNHAISLELDFEILNSLTGDNTVEYYTGGGRVYYSYFLPSDLF